MVRNQTAKIHRWKFVRAALMAGGLGLASPVMAQTVTQPTDSMAMDPKASAGMAGMGNMSAMMRPDASPPTGVVGGMHPPEGVLMPVFSFMNMEMDGNRSGTQSLSTSDVLSQYMIAPLSMSMNMAMIGLMYGVTDDISVMAMLPYTNKSMKHQTRMGQTFKTRAQGFGDLKIIGGYDVYKSDGQVLELSLGLSLPTGSIDETDTTPAGPDQLLPYPMQLGSGTYDLLPGITYTGQNADWSWGAQLAAMIRMGENDAGYTLGDVYSATVWGARRWNDQFSSSLRVVGDIVENIDGSDARLNPGMVPTADPTLRGGQFLSIGIGVNYLVPGSGVLAGTRLGIEGVIPVYQDLDGPQLERDYAVSFAIRRAF
jgi:hypothetical protein